MNEYKGFSHTLTLHDNRAELQERFRPGGGETTTIGYSKISSVGLERAGLANRVVKIGVGGQTFDFKARKGAAEEAARALRDRMT